LTGIDWTALVEKRIAPPYKPPVQSKANVNLIDPEFLRKSVEEMKSSGENVGAHFEGFTYRSDAPPK
jgi:hypothetical protein